MAKKIVKDLVFAEGDSIIVVDDNSPYAQKTGVIMRLGQAGDDVKYIHAELSGVNTIITFRTFQVQKG